MERYMAEFGQGYVQAAVLSENNAVKYKVSIAGSCTKSTSSPYARFQDQRIGPLLYSPGLTVLIFDTSSNSIVETKNYNFTSTPSSVNRAFMSYVDSIKEERLLLFISEGKLNTCTELEAWFALKSSSAWPNVWQSQTYNVAYSAFYITKPGAISAEHVLYNDGVTKESIQTKLDVVYDYYSDIGATGFPRRVIEHAKKVMSNGTDNEIIRLPADGITSPTAKYDLVPGDKVYLKFSLFADKALTETGTTRLSIRWFNGQTMISAHNVDFDIRTPDIWQDFEREYTVPVDCDQFTVYVAKTQPEGQGGVNNLIMGEVSREETPLFRSAEFGVNGIRMNHMNDGNVTELLILNDSKTDERGIVRSAEFREL